MADEEDYGATSQTSYGLAYNPLMPMGDPMAYARTRGPSGDASMGVGGFAPINVASAYSGPGGVHMPGGTANVPSPPRRGGDEGEPNPLQPAGQQPGLDQNQLGGIQQLLQAKGLMDLAAPPSAAAASAPGAPAPGAGAGPGRGPSGVSSTYAGPYQDLVNKAAAKWSIDPKLLTSQLFHESTYDPKATSSAGAKGLGQFMPATAKQYGVDVNDPASSIEGAAHYMSDLKKKYGGNDQLALAGYNWGPGWVDKWLQGKAKMPDETANYVKNITGRDIVDPNVATAAAAPMEAAMPTGALPGGGPTEIGRSGTGPGSGGRGVTAGGTPVTAPAPTPTPATAPETAKPGEAPLSPNQAMLGSDSMQRLWKFMLIRSLFPQLQFRNVGYDPWAVHRWGQHGGF